MIDELQDLERFRKRFFPKMSLADLIKRIRRGYLIKAKNKLVDFSSLSSVFDDWEHLTTTCKHYVREWLAQDESQLICELGKNLHCNRYTKKCDKYEPMLNLRSLKEILKEEKVVFS